MSYPLHRLSTLLLLLMVVFPAAAQVNAPLEGEEPMVLQIIGRITDGEKKLPGCAVEVFDGNELVGRQESDKTGYFSLGLGMGKEFALVFQREGFMPKKILVDTRAKLPKDLIGLPELRLELSMLPVAKYEGADTDVLDFPFAIVRWDKRTSSFQQDAQYTTGMMRANGALLLMSARSESR
jgi:hypothetical protein